MKIFKMFNLCKYVKNSLHVVFFFVSKTCNYFSGSRLESLYAPIRQKLASALVNWHPSDCSAKLILEPWRPVFSQGVMDAFVISNIVPKLAMALQTYVINPHQQHLGLFVNSVPLIL